MKKTNYGGTLKRAYQTPKIERIEISTDQCIATSAEINSGITSLDWDDSEIDLGNELI